MTVEEARQQMRLTFPALFFSSFEITSPQTIEYNCIAWAASCMDAWWWPGGPYWPDGTPHADTITAFCQAYGAFGFEQCENGEAESGFEKIALYVGPDSRVLHAARQLPDGKWTSKLGQEWDIILLFDFVLKRRLRLNGRRLARSVFETRGFFAVGAVAAQ